MRSILVFLCLLYAVRIRGAEINVEGFEGEEVSFQCSHKLAWGHSKYLCRGQCKSSRDVLVHVSAGGQAETGKISLLDSGNGVFTVTFRRLQRSDSGRYWCAVDRPMFDTFTEIHLSVIEAATTKATPDVSTTSMLQNVSKSITTATNQTSGSNRSDNSTTRYSSKGSVLHWYAVAAGVGGTLGTLMLLVVFRKCRKTRRVCSPKTDFGSETEADCEYDDVGEEFPSHKKLSQRPPLTQQSKEDPCGVTKHIYENIRCSRHTPGSATRAPVALKGALPPAPPANPGRGCPREHAERPSKPVKGRRPPRDVCVKGEARLAQQRSNCDSVGSRSTSLWFGLDIS